MVKIAIFLGIAWLCTKTKTWNKGPRISDFVDFKAVLISCFDEGPLRFQDDEQDNDDPNSNPHYNWNENA